MKKTIALVALALLPLGARAFLARAQDSDEPKKDEAKKDDAKKDDDKKKDEKSEDEQRKLLEKKLHVPFSFSEGTLDVSYNFTDRVQKKDWSFTGLQRVLVANDSSEKVDHMELGCGSEKTGYAVIDGIDFVGDFTMDLTVSCPWKASTGSLIYMFGMKDGKAFGVRWGDQIVKISKAGNLGFLTKNDSEAEREYSNLRTVTVKIERTGDEIQATVNNEARGKRKFAKKELDGKLGILLQNDIRVKVDAFHVKGVIAKLKG